VLVQVVEKLQLFADGKPNKPDGNPIDRNDVIQGGVNDCNVMAAIAALADKRPDQRSKAVTGVR
jgi:hypothetical protein